jgi:Xaa-Pro aminopeptidase
MIINEELTRARAELQRAGADWALLSSTENVTYVSHWEAPTLYGPMAHLSYVPPMALFGVAEPASFLLVHNFLAAGAKSQTTFDEVGAYDVVQLLPPYTKVSPKELFIALLRTTLRKAGLGRGKIKLAVEEGSLPTVVSQVIAEECPGVELISATPALVAARMVKTDREIERLRFTAEVINAGQKELIRQCQTAGKSDWEMWAGITQAMQIEAGRPLYVAGELVTGERCREIAPGGPVGYVTRPGDLARLDVSPRINGYWGDLTNTLVIGGVEPTAKQKRFKTAARDAFYAAADALRPGRLACDAFEAARAAFASHGLQIAHYAGHQIGLTVNEAPWLIPTDETPIRAGMVFSIECGSYEGAAGEVGARVEKSVIVAESGPEIFPDFDWVF